MQKAGRPTELTNDLTLKIRQGVIDGKPYKQIQEELDINPNTWDTWVYKDYESFRDNLVKWRREKIFNKSEEKLAQLLDSENEDIVARVAIHSTKTLGKEYWSEKSNIDITSKGEKISALTQLNDEELRNIAQASDGGTG